MECEIKLILPSLESVKVEQLLDLFLEIGVCGNDDLPLLKESDLVKVLKPIEARKLINHWKNRAASSTPSPQSSQHSTEAVSLQTSSSESGTGGVGAADWAFNFMIPWSSFPSALLEACEAGLKPEKRLRLQMIRVLVDEIHTVCKHPKFKDAEKVAFRLISRYPQSFKDVVEDIVIGSGLESLTTQIMYRSDNLRRNASVQFSQSNAATASVASGPSMDELEYLKSAYFLAEKDYKKVDEIMEKAYKNIVEDVQKKLMIAEIKSKWPFLFEKKFMFKHYEKLQNVQDFRKKFCEQMKSGAINIFE